MGSRNAFQNAFLGKAFQRNAFPKALLAQKASPGQEKAIPDHEIANLDQATAHLE